MPTRYWLTRKALIAGLLSAYVVVAQASEEALIERGRYLVSIMDCTGCHTPGALAGQPQHGKFLGGSDIGFAMPPPPGSSSGGVVYPPNLTPNSDLGLGRWSDEEILAAVRDGRGRGNRPLVPIMPWPSYANLNDDDARALVAFLRSIPPVRHQVPAAVAPGTDATAPYLTMVVPESN
jgi:mono/diheme cytochrome c family protein